MEVSERAGRRVLAARAKGAKFRRSIVVRRAERRGAIDAAAKRARIESPIRINDRTA
jgi:hypothetical protein